MNFTTGFYNFEIYNSTYSYYSMKDIYAVNNSLSYAYNSTATMRNFKGLVYDGVDSIDA